MHRPETREDVPWDALARVLAATGACEDVASAVRVVADQCVGLLRADAVSVSQVELERGIVRTLVNAGELGPDEVRLPLDEVYPLADFPSLERLVGSAEPWRIREADEDGDPQELALLARLGRHAALAAPVVVDGRVWGEVYVSRSAPEDFDDDDVALLEVVAAHAGTVVGLLQRSDRRAAHAEADPLTGLLRRDAAERLVVGAPHGVVLAAFDLDGLKEVNDEFGHAAGDRLLVEVAGALTAVAATLPGALVARVGGDEFVLVVPGQDVDAVHAACVRARAVVAEVLPGAGLSCGIASSSDLTGGLASGRPLFRLADATLYRAKRAGATEPVRAWRGQGVSYPDAGGAAWVDHDASAWQHALGRLRVPVDVFARSVNAAAWWISHVPGGSDRLVTRDRLVLRDRRQEDGAPWPDLALLGAVYELEHLPWTQDALQGRSHYARINDPGVHPTEQMFLAELNYTGNLMAGATDPSGDGWLVEIFCDPVTAQLDRMGDALVQLVRRALGGPPG